MKVLVVYCHPLEGSFATQVRDRALVGLRAAGHEVRLTDLYAEGFTPELSAWEHEHHLDPPETKPDIARHADDLRWCDALVLAYPTWWSGQPAMLKGWIDRVWVTGVAYDLPPGSNRIRPRLKNIRRLVVLTTHGSSKWMNTLQGEGGKRVAFRSLRVLCHPLVRTKWVALYAIDTCTPDDRQRFLDRVEKTMLRL
jgi:putative NADPH-quinone reductase